MPTKTDIFKTLDDKFARTSGSNKSTIVWYANDNKFVVSMNYITTDWYDDTTHEDTMLMVGTMIYATYHKYNRLSDPDDDYNLINEDITIGTNDIKCIGGDFEKYNKFFAYDDLREFTIYRLNREDNVNTLFFEIE